MKGLLLKDFCILKKQMKLMVVFVIFYAIWAVAAKMPTMMGTMVILLSIMMPISSMSYDEAGQWYRYAFFLAHSAPNAGAEQIRAGIFSLIGRPGKFSGNWQHHHFGADQRGKCIGILADHHWISGTRRDFSFHHHSHIIQIRCGERSPFSLSSSRLSPSLLVALLGSTLKTSGTPHAQRRTPAGNFVFLSSVYPGDFSNFLPHFSGNLPKKRILKIPVFL